MNGENIFLGELEAKELEEMIEEDVTRIDFSHPLIEAEIDDLMRYLVAELDEKNRRGLRISLSLNKNRHYGTRWNEGKYESLYDVEMKLGDIKIGGTISRTTPFGSVSFVLRSDYDGLDRPVFIGLDFHVTPGYESEELESNNVEIMRYVKQYTQSFFELSKKT